MEEPTEERLIVLETTPTFGSSVRCVSLLCIHFTLEGSCELPEKRFLQRLSSKLKFEHCSRNYFVKKHKQNR